LKRRNLWHSKNHREAYFNGANRSGAPKVANLLLRGQKQRVNVIYLKKRLKLYRPVNTPPLRLLNAERLEEVNNFLNNRNELRKRQRGTDPNVLAYDK